MSRRLAPVPTTPPRAVLYLRQSTTREESISLELQEMACRDYADRAGYIVVGVEADPGISGRTWNRPGVQRVMDLVETHQVDVVVLWKWSRLSRSRRDWAIAADRVDVAGGRIESATEAVDVATSVGRLARGMLTEFAAFESERMGEVWREVHQRRLSQGLPSRGGERYGYVRDGDVYTPDPVTAPILAGLYDRYLEGIGLTALAIEETQAGRMSRTGRPWTRDRLTKVLDSGFAAGLLIRGRGPGATYSQGAHEPIVSAGVWEAYLRERRRRATAPQSRAPRYVLSGLIRCGDCGSAMHALSLGVEPGYGYICSRYQASKRCRCVTVTRAKAEAAVVEALTAIASDVDAAAARHLRRGEVRVLHRAESEELARQVARLDERVTRLTLGWTEGLVPDAAYRRSLDELQAERERVAVLLDAAADAARPPVDGAAAAHGLLAMWETAPVLARRNLLLELFSAVLVHRGEKRNAVTVEVVAR